MSYVSNCSTAKTAELGTFQVVISSKVLSEIASVSDTVRCHLLYLHSK